jgi:3-oxoadipate enol-lactonase
MARWGTELRAEVAGATIAFDDIGTGPPLLFIHAGIAGRSMWDAQVAYFAPDHRVIRIDLRGFGESSHSSLPFAHRDDARALLEKLGVERCTVVGVSMGAEIALDLALEHPASVDGLVLVSTLAAMDRPSPGLVEIWRASSAAFTEGDIARATLVEVQGWIVGAGRSPADVDQIYRTLATRMIRSIWERAALWGEEPEEIEFSPPRAERLSELSVPVLLVHGDRDLTDVVNSMERLAREIPGASQAVMRNCAHLPPLEDPGEFNSILEAFLNRRP